MLLAYVSRYGGGPPPPSPASKIESLLPTSPAQTPEARRQHLNAYLSDLSQPPPLGGDGIHPPPSTQDVLTRSHTKVQK